MQSFAYLSICEYCIEAHAPVSFSPYLFSIGKLYSSQSHTLAWGGDTASPQVTALCFGIFWARVPILWLWLPKKYEENMKVILEAWLAFFKIHHCAAKQMALPEVLLLPLSELLYEPPVLWSRLWLNRIILGWIVPSFPCRLSEEKRKQAHLHHI